jgi:hypothetical protein
MNRVENKRALEHTSWPLIKCKWHKMDHKIKNGANEVKTPLQNLVLDAKLRGFYNGKALILNQDFI